MSESEKGIHVLAYCISLNYYHKCYVTARYCVNVLGQSGCGYYKVK